MSPDSTTTIHFVRHGSVHNPGEVFYGRLPRFKLSAEGLRQAQAAALFLKDKSIRAVISSPLLRARQTARVIAASLGSTQVSLSSRLNEARTPFDGKPTRELDAINWDLYSGTSAPYEQPIDIFNRALRFIRLTLIRYPGQQIVAVTHADIIVFLSLWANGYAINFKNKSLIEHRQIAIQYPANASVTSLSWDSQKPFTQVEPRKIEVGQAFSLPERTRQAKSLPYKLKIEMPRFEYSNGHE
jgi:broad specificity phosphatase PhoE